MTFFDTVLCNAILRHFVKDVSQVCTLVLDFFDVVALEKVDFWFIWSVFQGAATTCYLALNPKVNGITGEYFSDNNLAEPSQKAKDQALAKELWDFSLRLTSSKWLYKMAGNEWGTRIDPTY